MYQYKNIKIIFFVVIILLFSGCSRKEETQTKHKDTEAESIEINSDMNFDTENKQNLQNNRSGQVNTDIYDLNYLPLKGDNFKNIGERLPYKNEQGQEIYFTVNSVKYTKKTEGKILGQLERDSLDAYGIEYDDQGDILNDFSYIWMQIDVEAVEECNWNPLQFIIVTINEDYSLYQDIGPYLFYFDGIQETQDQEKGIFYKTFPKGEKTDISLGFFSKDEILEKKLGYLLSNGTVPNNPSENDYVVLLHD